MTYSTPDAVQRRAHPRLAWPFIAGLGALALVEPAVHALGLFESVHPAARHFAVLAAVSGVWLALIAYVRPPRPFVTVVLAGVCYVVVLATVGLVVGPVLGISDGSPGLWVLPIAIVSMASTHMLWFVLVGALAHVLVPGRAR
ncbi:hypothetical protein ONR57_17055 [Hoyosella sp. YIM 151337]|uniref:hypothetical protein n=1 Tax=Hoyosella sp. YIM 151337 TaxID=2992742 RepID=UPI002236C0CC|nr:hypothetical protein [Hoyosella sp. YIM 151337]MCW4355015.1 hypothetical protein [Hoyosella sp. YIM 151337]